MSEPYYDDDAVQLYHGDCLDVLRNLPDASVDAVVTDPPYGLEFMGKAWDSFGRETGNGYREAPRINDRSGEGFPGHRGAAVNSFQAGRPFQAWCELWAVECLRVLKPGGHMLAFGGTRTWHRLAAAVEDAGFEIRDSIAWLYGSGFPKSLNVSKQIDGLAMTGKGGSSAWRHANENRPGEAWVRENTNNRTGQWVGDKENTGPSEKRDTPATPDAVRWQGWGTALKPAFEPIVVARKPLTSTVAGNVLAYGTGALNIDACRVQAEDAPAGRTRHGGGVRSDHIHQLDPDARNITEASGRWPANVTLDDTQADALDQQSGTLTSGQPGTMRKGRNDGAAYGAESRPPGTPMTGFGDSGGASRFFPTFRYEAKAPTVERPRVAKAGTGTDDATNYSATLKTRACRVCGSRGKPAGGEQSGKPWPTCGHGDWEMVAPLPPSGEFTAHPTVKPLDLMRWLVRLVTPPGGTVLEPFAGSGTTAEACVLEGFRCIAVEREADYLPLIVQRLSKPLQPGLGIDFGDGAA